MIHDEKEEDPPRQTVVLMGDSVLDNFYWIEDPKQWLRPVLQQRMGPGWECINLAVDQMSTYDFLEREPERNPWRNYEDARKRIFPADSPDSKYMACPKDGRIRSVHNLATLRHYHGRQMRAVLVSVGGNDVFLNRYTQTDLAWSILPWYKRLRADVAQQFKERLMPIFTELTQAVTPKTMIIPVIAYHPSELFSLSGIQGSLVMGLQNYYLSSLVTPMVAQMLNLAHHFRFPVMDLSRTFDRKNAAHYGTGAPGKTNCLGAPWSGAEPSNMSTKFIAELAHHIIKTHDVTGPSKVYFGIPDGDRLRSIHIEINDEQYHERYQFAQMSCFCHGRAGFHQEVPPLK